MMLDSRETIGKAACARDPVRNNHFRAFPEFKTDCSQVDEADMATAETVP